MPLAPAIALLLTDHTTRDASLTIGGVDVLFASNGGSGNRIGVPIDSITVNEESPGAVSSMTFDYEDPLATGSLPQDGDEVQFWDRVADIPLFGGWVDHWDTRPAFGGQGRITTVNCVGYEIILDWALLTADLVIPAGTQFSVAVQAAAGAAEGTFGLRAFAGSAVVATQALPVSILVPTFAPTAYAITISAGTSLRGALQAIGVAVASNAGSVSAVFTVDFYLGLRAMRSSNGAPTVMSSDWADLTVTDTYASTRNAAGLDHQTDASQIVRGVFVKGLNAAGTGIRMDGSGKPGRIAYLSDSTIDTAAKLADAQTTYLAQFQTATRGSFDLQDWNPGQAPGATIRTGSILTLTDAATGVASTFRIMGIQKTFRGSRETWQVAYGGRRPGAANLIRSLTRFVRS